jgi:hypothetical protein
MLLKSEVIMEEKFDIKELQKRIAEVKEETQKLTRFTRKYLECLIKRHDLQNIIFEEQEFEDVPDEIADLLKKGELPTEEQIAMIDEETQDYLLKECVFICGMGAIAFYSQTEEESDEPTEFDNILEMINVSPAHYVAVHLIAALTLLFCRIPSFESIQLLTKNFDQSEEQIQTNLELYNEFCLCIYNRYVEDEEYYGNEK